MIFGSLLPPGRKTVIPPKPYRRNGFGGIACTSLCSGPQRHPGGEYHHFPLLPQWGVGFLLLKRFPVFPVSSSQENEEEKRSKPLHPYGFGRREEWIGQTPNSPWGICVFVPLGDCDLRCLLPPGGITCTSLCPSPPNGRSGSGCVSPVGGTLRTAIRKDCDSPKTVRT